MKISSFLVATAAAVALASAQDVPATTAPALGPGTVSAPTDAPAGGVATTKPAGASSDKPSTSSGSGASSPKPSSKPAPKGDGKSPLDGLKQKEYAGQWHMKPVRVVHARVQSDSPQLIKGRFVSSFGKGDLDAGYLSGMDGVNTASVEGALMYVQAEGINENSRDKSERCIRKSKMRNIVFYEILIAQTNETLAQFVDNWDGWKAPEYGPFMALDGGMCTPLKGNELPPECLQFNGMEQQPNVGPYVGAGFKDVDIRAPYPEAYWFSFPNTCPQKKWAEKTEECRKATRMGLCPIGTAPDGVQCTFAYDILGWVTIDDVVGFTSETNEKTGKKYSNFTEWCEDSSDHIEFKGDPSTGKADKNYKFWDKPLDAKANAERAQRVVDVYNDMLNGDFKSGMIAEADVKAFKPLPSPDELRKQNPKCYESVKSCNTGNGCRRDGYFQLCRACDKKEDGCEVNPSYKFPALQKAPTPLKEEALQSTVSKDAKGSNTVVKKKDGSSAGASSGVSSLQVAAASVAASLLAALAF
ncbi:hypothetical protein PINS_up011097 [Pythium insidiosum]|nr:hypothetical protein PINS_up011097 [Pythium insidiosum]